MSTMSERIREAKEKQEELRKQKELDKDIAKQKEIKENIKKSNGIKKGEPEMTKQLKGLQRQFQLFGKTIKISELQENYEFLKVNQTDLINVISWGINTIKNKKSVKEKNPDNQYYRNFITWNKLREYLRKI